MTDQDFEYICKLLAERSAVVLDDSKQYLVKARLEPVVRQHNISSISELVRQMRAQPGHAAHAQVVEALVTNETSFFRDHHPFEALRKVVIPELMRRRQSERCLNIWCGASSTGQEPYSVALLLMEHFPELANWKVKLLASDLSREALARARVGRYNQVEVNRGLPATLLVKYFQQDGQDWQLDARVRKLVEFQEINLARPWPPLARMDLVLLRNVMIYFDVDVKKTILGKLTRQLRPDGYLCLGGAETTINLDDSFRRVEPLKAGLYQLVG
jgi:chemotaxis protein methyltransferase CheR